MLRDGSRAIDNMSWARVRHYFIQVMVDAMILGCSLHLTKYSFEISRDIKVIVKEDGLLASFLSLRKDYCCAFNKGMALLLASSLLLKRVPGPLATNTCKLALLSSTSNPLSSPLLHTPAARSSAVCLSTGVAISFSPIQRCYTTAVPPKTPQSTTKPSTTHISLLTFSFFWLFLFSLYLFDMCVSLSSVNTHASLVCSQLFLAFTLLPLNHHKTFIYPLSPFFPLLFPLLFLFLSWSFSLS